MCGFLRPSLAIFLCQVALESLPELSPCQQHPAPAAFALKPDIRAKAHDGPLIRPTGMRLAQTKKVVQLEINQHLYAMDLGKGCLALVCQHYTAPVPLTAYGVL